MTQSMEEKRAHLICNPDGKRHMANAYLMDSDNEAFVNFMKDHQELYKKN